MDRFQVFRQFGGFVFEVPRGGEHGIEVLLCLPCPDDVLCTAMRKVIEPYDIVVTGMNELSTGADRISAISTQTM
ncbi:hypothetical protein FVP45_10855, partial [Mycobacterium tuberculosis]|nr:hypothetical protein [Mycobacterium tuberculosis]